MHELAVTEQLLNIVLEHANRAKAERVVKINVVIGELTSFNDESIQFYLDILSEGTKAERASLSISRVPARCSASPVETNSLRRRHIGSAPGAVGASKRSYRDGNAMLRALKWSEGLKEKRYEEGGSHHPDSQRK